MIMIKNLLENYTDSTENKSKSIILPIFYLVLIRSFKKNILMS